MRMSTAKTIADLHGYLFGYFNFGRLMDLSLEWNKHNDTLRGQTEPHQDNNGPADERAGTEVAQGL